MSQIKKVVSGFLLVAKVVGFLLMAWGVWVVVDLRESVQATAVARWIYVHLSAPRILMFTIAFLIIGIGLIFSAIIREKVANWLQNEATANITVHKFELRSMRFTNDPPDTVRWYSLHLCLKNDSQVTAEKVGAAIKFSKIENRVLQSLIELEHGRWADGPYPSPEHPKSEINLTDFGPQQIRDLDIALKYPDDVDCYAVNNDNFVGVQELRIDMYRLKGTNVVADVKIQGANLKKNLLCRLSFRNPGKGGKPERLNWIG